MRNCFVTASEDNLNILYFSIYTLYVILLTFQQLRLTHFNETLDADRTVPEQPLKYTKQVYNYRKLNELPYHLLYAHNVKGLIEVGSLLFV